MNSEYMKKIECTKRVSMPMREQSPMLQQLLFKEDRDA